MSLKYQVHINCDYDPAYRYIEYTRHGVEHKLGGVPAEIWGDGSFRYFEYGTPHPPFYNLSNVESL